MLAEMIRSDARAEEPAERIFFAGRSNRGGPCGHGPARPQRSEPCEFVGSGSHLRTQPVENGERSFFRARCQIAGGADAGWTALLAGTRGDQFARLLHQERVRSKQRLGKAYAAGISVVQVQVWFEEFPGVEGDCVFQTGRSEIL